MTLAEAMRLARSIQDEMLRAGVLRIAKVVTSPERFEALEMVLSACVPCAELREATCQAIPPCGMCEHPFTDDEGIRLVEGRLVCDDCYNDLPGPETTPAHPFGYGEFDTSSGVERDEPAKPEVGPMQDAESLSGVQALGSSGLSQSVSVEQAKQDLIETTPGAQWEYWLPCLDALIAAVRAETQAWQPIDSAPKDGTHVLLFWSAEHGSDYVEYFACGAYGRFRDGSGGWGGESFLSRPDGYWTRLIMERPSHWMPILNPPRPRQ